jgi:hypothetical protein
VFRDLFDDPRAYQHFQNYLTGLIVLENMLSQTVSIRPCAEDSYLILDDTLCEHVGSLFEYVERHYHHSEDRYPLAHNLVTSHYVSGAVRFPVDDQLYQRYESATDWEGFVGQHFPSQIMPQTAKERAKLHRQLDQQLRQDPEFERLQNARLPPSNPLGKSVGNQVKP